MINTPEQDQHILLQRKSRINALTGGPDQVGTLFTQEEAEKAREELLAGNYDHPLVQRIKPFHSDPQRDVQYIMQMIHLPGPPKHIPPHSKGGHKRLKEAVIAGIALVHSALQTESSSQMGLNYLALLEHSYLKTKEWDVTLTRLEYLSQHVFDFTLYDSAMETFFATKAVEVCEAITDGTVSRYIFGTHRHTNIDQPTCEENYRWYLALVNMPFYTNRLEWGTSIRGAWWMVSRFVDGKIVRGQTILKSGGFFEGEDQLQELIFNNEQWVEFIRAVIVFARTAPIAT